MFLYGKHAECEVFNDEIGQNEMTQIYSFLNCPIFADATLKIMPDHHAGAGAVIGFTAHYPNGIKNVCPNVIGVDIGCGVLGVNLGQIDIDYKALDDFIRKEIPSGCTIRQRAIYRVGDVMGATINHTKQDITYVSRSMGTLGGGNHFIEVGQTPEGDKWLIVHSGSRNFGLKIAGFYQDIAKKENPYGALSWLNEDTTKDYLRDMSVAQNFATENREMIIQLICDNFFRSDYLMKVESVHNYIDIGKNIMRKGAIDAGGKKVLIPWNMRDGVLLGYGYATEAWNFSAPHGAGRTMSRSAAKERLNLEEFQKEMQGIWSSCIHKSTIDEAPMAYKDHQKVFECLKGVVEPIATIKPVYNFKAS